MSKRTSVNGAWIVGVWILGAGWAAGTWAQEAPVRFNKNFEGASIGRIEVVGPAEFRCHVEGQYDERGHNRQATWFYFRVDGAAGRDVTLTLTDFVGEYNDKPGAVGMGPGIVPVFSDDGAAWRHFEEGAATWDAKAKELTLRFRPAADKVWIAHVPPYTWSDLRKLLGEVERSPHARVETIGRSAGGREMPMVTVTDWGTPDDGKKVVWLQARQHAWEAGTSYVMEGALRFVTSEDPAATELRKRVVFRFTPMVDVDGCALGRVRFNANGYDVNRHWAKVDLRDKAWLERAPEIWYAKKAIVGAGRIDLMVNMHNTETGEYVATHAEEPATRKMMERFYGLLVERTSFDPSLRLATGKGVDDTNSLWETHKVPVMLMEQRISAGKKLGRRATVEDRRAFGRALVGQMAGVVLGE
jgi:hypothetical protein